MTLKDELNQKPHQKNCLTCLVKPQKNNIFRHILLLTAAVAAAAAGAGANATAAAAAAAAAGANAAAAAATASAIAAVAWWTASEKKSCRLLQ